MALLRPPKLSEIGQSIGPQIREWWKRESTRASRRRLLLIAIVVASGWFGPVLIASSVFPDRQTAIDSVEAGGRCTYDAIPAAPIDRRAPPPAPSPMVTGVTTAYNIAIRNTGSCAWDDRVALWREGGSLTDTPISISATATISRNGLLTIQIPFTAPMQIGVFDSSWRLRAPDDRAFGATFSFSVITHREGEAPRYPPKPLLTPIQWLAVMAVVVSGACGLVMALIAGGRFMRDFYGLKNERLGREHLLRLMFNLSKPVSAKAAEGKLEVGAEHEAIDKIGGPGSLSVDGGTKTIIVLERGSRFSRIVGGGTQALAPFERVRAVIDARRLSRSKSEAAYTKDGIEIKVDTTTSFRLAERMAGEQIPAPPYHEPVWNQIQAKLGLKVTATKPPERLYASPEAVRAIVYDGFAGIDWDKTVSTGIADEIPKKMLDDLWAIDDPARNPRRELIEELRAKTSESLRERGIELIDFSFGPLNVAKEVIDRRRESWQAYWKKDGRITEAKGDAEALQLRELARIEAQTRMIKAIVHGLHGMQEPINEERLSEVIALRFIDAVESIAGVWLSDENRADYLNVLKELRKLPR